VKRVNQRGGVFGGVNSGVFVAGMGKHSNSLGEKIYYEKGGWENTPEESGEKRISQTRFLL